MINKTKYAVLMLSANIFLCSAEKKCEFLNLLTNSHPHEINNTINTELQEILENQIEVTPKNEPKLNTNKKKKKVITLKKLLDYGLKQKANGTKEESAEKIREQNLKIIETLIKEFESSKLPKILNKIVNTESLIEAYKEDETFQKLTYDEQMKLVLMFWCLQYGIEFDFQNETIEEFTAKITYSNIKKTLNEKIEELINGEKEKTNNELDKAEANEEEDSKNWESYNTFKIGDDEDIKPLFYYFIKECILTSIAILIHKYCALCKDKFGDVFIGENKGKFTEYTYMQKNNKWWGNSDEGDTIAQTQNLFYPNHKYTRICNISFEDLTILIQIIKELPDLSIFRKAAPNKGVDAPNKGVDKEAVEKFFKAFPEYKKLLGFIKEKENEVTGKKIKFDKVHFYDIKKFFDQKTEVKGIDDTAQKEKIKDETLSSQHTFGDLISIDKEIVNQNIKNIKNINTFGKNSEHQVLNLSFNKCKFTNPNVDITNLVDITKLIEEEKTDEQNNESDNEYSDDFFE